MLILLILFFKQDREAFCIKCDILSNKDELKLHANGCKTLIDDGQSYTVQLLM